MTSRSPVRRLVPPWHAAPGQTLPGPLDLLHPFPSALNALAAAVFTLIAGGSGLTAAVAAMAMALLQTSIGCLNDVVDYDRDRFAHPGKPLVAGRVGRGPARLYAIGASAVGLGLSAALGPLPAMVAAAGLAAGVAYDLRLSRTPWSWIPYAIGLPLVPAFGWAAARGRLPGGFLGLLALGVVAGAALAIANGLADLEADTAAESGGLARVLGRRRSERLIVALQTLVALAASGVVLAGPRTPASIAGLCVAVPLLALGVAASHAASAATRERGWEVQAVAVCILGFAWLAATQPGSGG
jgi:4-hydroxybenzoate polyprenyltransferase